MNEKNTVMLIRFVIYGLSGWILETLFTGFASLFRGDLTMFAWTYIWMFPIYGLAIFLEPIHERIRDIPAVFRGGIYMVLIFAAEYLSGRILIVIIGKCPWNYGNSPLTVEGIITATFIPIWFLVGLAFERLHDYLLGKSIGVQK